MKVRIITAIVLIMTIIPIVLIGGTILKLLALILSIGYTYEMISIFGKNYHIFSKFAFYSINLLFNICLYFISGYQNVALIGNIILLISLPIFDQEVKISDCTIYFVIELLVSLMCKTIIELRNTSLFLLFLVLISTFLTDALALFVGKACGKHKLCERISPNKTIEGAIGSYILTCILLIIYSYICFKSLNTQIWLMCLLMPFTGQIGDLVFSDIKRTYGVKDFGNIFPGHGGILDRFDSLSFNCLVYLLITVVLA